MKKSILTLALLAGFGVISSAQAQTTVIKSGSGPATMVTTNPDGSTTTTTSSSRTTTTYTRLNDTDPRVASIKTPSEFNTYAYSRWDKNGDGSIEPDEWNSNVVTWYGPGVTTYKTYADWDMNHNGKLDQNEFARVMNDTDLYKTWNVTSTTTAVPMSADASFAAYDLNGDGSITSSEWAKTHQ